MQEAEQKRWLMPLKERCIELVDKNKEDVKDLTNICSLIAHQYKLSNIMSIKSYLISSKVPRGLPSPLSCREMAVTAKCSQTRTVFNISNRFVEYLIKYIDSYRKRKICYGIQDMHGAFYDLLAKRNVWYVQNRNLLPPYQKTEDINITSDHGRPPRLDDDFTNRLQSVFQTSERKANLSFDSKYIPSVNVLHYIQAQIKDDKASLVEKLAEMSKDLDRTRMELINEKAELQKKANAAKEFLDNLPIEKVSESNLYKDYVNSSKLLLPEVRKNINGLMKPLEEVTDLMKILNESIWNAIPLDHLNSNESEQLKKTYIKEKIDLEKYNLFRKLIDDAKIHPYRPTQSEQFFAFEKDFIETITNTTNNGRYNELATRIEAAMSQFLQFDEYIPKENDYFTRATNAATSDMQHWASSHPTPDQYLIYEINTLRKRVEEMKSNYSAKLANTQNMIHQTLEMHEKAVNYSHFIEPVQDGFHTQISEKSKLEAHKKWLKNRLEAKRKIVQDKRRKVELAKKELQNLQEGSKKLTQEIAELSEKSKNKAPIKRAESKFVDYEEKCLCPLCSSNMRSVFISGCRHTFCKECIDKQIKARNRNCPTCGSRFDKSHIQDINWSKD